MTAQPEKRMTISREKPPLRAREEIARIIDPKAWTEVKCAPEDRSIWALSRQKDRDTALAKADAILSCTAPPES